MDKQYQPWYEQFPTRFEAEKADMKERGFVLNDEALLLDQRVEFTGRSEVNPDRPLVVRYPREFPSFPPRVYSETPGQVLLRHHHPTSWEICLFAPGQPRWSADLSGVAAIDEAETVIRLFTPGSAPVLGDNVPEPVTTLFSYFENAAVIVPPDLATPTLPAEGSTAIVGTFRMRYRPVEAPRGNRLVAGRGVVLSTRVEGQSVRANAPYQRWSAGGQEVEGSLVLLPSQPPIWSRLADFHRWIERMKVVRKDWMAFAFPEQSATAEKARVGWLIVRTYPVGGNVECIRTFPYRLDERLARVPGLEGLAGKRVVFIGCGSMGSKIAVALAATGVNHFGLVDGDIMEPDNAIRHEVGVEEFGTLKVRALANRLGHVNPAAFTAGIEMLGSYLGGDTTVEFNQKLHAMIAASDLVVDTTGVHAVRRWLNDTCSDLRVPAVYAGVTNGAWGGEIIRVIPGQTACWLCWFKQYEQDRPPEEPRPDAGVFAPGCDQPTFTGTTYEVGVVANLAAWMAVETLLRDEPTRPTFDGDYLRWAARTPSGALRLAPQVLHVKKRDYCPWCNP